MGVDVVGLVVGGVGGTFVGGFMPLFDGWVGGVCAAVCNACGAAGFGLSCCCVLVCVSAGGVPITRCFAAVRPCDGFRHRWCVFGGVQGKAHGVLVPAALCPLVPAEPHEGASS